MLKKLVLPLIILLSISFITLSFYVLDFPQTFAVSREEVVYNLPYPGILPDHPLYPVKIIRDRILEFTTRDNIKKAELYLLLSDKRVSMAMALVKKGKDKMAVTTFAKGEKYFFKIPKIIKASKEQGVGASSDFIQRLKLSNAKHRELLETLLKDLPTGQNEEINDIIRINQELKEELE
jgi:hypothetical protein